MERLQSTSPEARRDSPGGEVASNPGRRIRLLLGGATGSGKTDLAIAVAERKGWEILSCDSGQARVGLEIGTASPTAAQRARVAHHGLGVLAPDAPDSVGDFLQRARDLLAAPGPDLVAVGGTGQYLSGLREGLDAAPVSDPDLRATLEERLRTEGAEALHAELEARETPPHDARTNPVRLLRALEKSILRERGAFGEAIPALAPNAPAFALSWPREVLHRRLAERLDLMLDSGWQAETARLRMAGIPLDAPGLRSIGYAELWDVPWEAPVPGSVREAILVRTRAYARRQETWLRNRLHAEFLDATLGEDALVGRILSSLEPS